MTMTMTMTMTTTRRQRQRKSPRTSPTVADVRRRARQSTCHATPGSFELIAGTPLPLHPASRHHRVRRFHHTLSFRPFLLVSSPPALTHRPLFLLLLLLRLAALYSFVISVGMRAVAVQAERCRCTWYLSALSPPPARKFCIAWEWLVGSDGKSGDVNRISAIEEPSFRRRAFPSKTLRGPRL